MAKARLLAVDDQLYFRVFLEELLTQEGYEVETAGGGEEALSRLESQCFDLLLTDLMMPGLHGRDLVQRVRERLPDQEIIVVTSLGDVATAVDAMKLGATDFLVKPIERSALVRAVETALRQRRIRQEHARLMAENLEFLGAFSLYERCAGLFSSLAPGPLADRIAEGLSLETSAQGAVVWVEEEPGLLRLASARGIVRVDDEPAELRQAALPPELERLSAKDVEVFEGAARGTGPPPLFVPLAHEGRLVGLARLTDKIAGSAFDERDRFRAEKFAGFAGIALSNALRFQLLEQRSFRDAASGAYTQAYFEDVVRNEIQKASRFGRSFSLLRIEPEGLGPVAPGGGASEPARAVADLANRIERTLRRTDLVAIDADHCFSVFLPETDGLGAAILKQRIREAAAEVEGRGPGARGVAVAAASYPIDGTQLDVLRDRLGRGVTEDRCSRAHALERENLGFGAMLDQLVADAPPGHPHLADQVARFLLREAGRRPRDRGVLFLSPGAVMHGAMQEGLQALRGVSTRTQIVALAERRAPPGVPVHWVSPVRAGTRVPFLIYCGEGPAYALAQHRASDRGRPALFHTSDRPVVEHLAFTLARELGLAIGG